MSAVRTDTEILDFLERDAGRTVYPHDSFGGREWAFQHYAFMSLRQAAEVAMDHAARMAALDADPQLPQREYAERKAAWAKAMTAWRAGGNVGSPPPYPVPPHTVGRR